MRAAEAGEPEAARRVAEWFQHAGQKDEALEWYQRAVDIGDVHSARAAGLLLQGQGRSAEALTFLKLAFESGDHIAAQLAVDRMRSHGMEISEWAAQASASEPMSLTDHFEARGSIKPDVPSDVARVRGEREEMERSSWGTWRCSIGRKADQLRDHGQVEEALRLYVEAAGAGEPYALRRAAGMLRLARRPDDAVEWYQRAAADGDSASLWRAANTLAAHGRDEEALHWHQQASEAGVDDGLVRAVYLLRRRGRLDEALTWAERAAATGVAPDALALAVDLLHHTGQSQAAQRLARYGWHTDGSISEPW